MGKKLIDPKKPMFGEAPAIGGREVVWAPSYEEARAAAIELLEHFPMLDQKRDFWISSENSKSENKVEFKRIIVSLSGCQKINDALPRAYQFEPASVEISPLSVDYGVAFLYRDSNQGVFTTGEANPMNCDVSYMYATAEKRVFCRAVLQLVFKMLGISGESVYSEVEADAFEENKSPVKRETDGNAAESERPKAAPGRPAIPEPPREIYQDMNEDETEQPEPSKTAKPANAEKAISPAPPQTKEGGIWRNIAELMEKTGTKEKDVCEYYFKQRSDKTKPVRSISDLTYPEAENLMKTLLKKNGKQEKERSEKADAPMKTRTSEEVRAFAESVVANSRSYAEKDEPTLLLDDEEGFEDDDDIPTFACDYTAPPEVLDLIGKTLDEIGEQTLRSMFGRKNSKARVYVDVVMLAEIDAFLASAKKAKKEAVDG